MEERLNQSGDKGKATLKGASSSSCFRLLPIRIRVLTFSEWTADYSSKEPVLEESSASPLPGKSWTIEVPFEKSKGYVEQPKTLGEHIRKKRILSGLTQKALAELTRPQR